MQSRAPSILPGLTAVAPAQDETVGATRKYPMMGYFYERLSDNLHGHFVPAPGGSSINISFYVTGRAGTWASTWWRRPSRTEGRTDTRTMRPSAQLPK
jgi:hypothetical protein